MPEGLVAEEMTELLDQQKELQTLFMIAVDIKAGRLPESYSVKGTEFANKYEGEELEKFAFGSFY